jgi:predicted Zn-dependent protease
MARGSIEYQAQAFHTSFPRGKAAGLLTVDAQSISFAPSDPDVSQLKVTFLMRDAEFKLGGASDRLLFISHPNEPAWSVYTSDLSVLRDQYLSNIPSIKKQLASVTRKRIINWSVLLACLCLVVSLPIILLTRMDWVSTTIAEKIPATWETELGKSTIAQIKAGQAVLDQEAVEAALDEFIQPLLDQVDSDRYAFKVAVIDNPNVNAFALPGGFIVLNSGLIKESDHADEVLGVLAHEIIHVTEQHGIRNLINAAGIFLLVDALLGDVNGILAMLTNAAPLLINQRYSRSFETEADTLGVNLLVKTGINPKGLIIFFEKLRNKEKERMKEIDNDQRDLLEDALGFLSTHPATNERIANIKALSKKIEGPFEDYQDEFLLLKRAIWQQIGQDKPAETN